MSFEWAGEGRGSVGTAPEHVTVRLLHKALGVERGLMGAIYTLNPETSTYSISGSFGVERESVDRMRGELVFRPGEERGFVGVVASRRTPVYLPDVDATGFNETSAIHVGSAYMVPVINGDGVPAIVAVISERADGVSPELRAAIDSLADFAGLMFAVESRLRTRVRAIEVNMRSLSLEWADILGTFQADPHHEIDDRLRALSPREWEVVEGLQAGRRTATIARDLQDQPQHCSQSREVDRQEARRALAGRAARVPR